MTNSLTCVTNIARVPDYLRPHFPAHFLLKARQSAKAIKATLLMLFAFAGAQAVAAESGVEEEIAAAAEAAPSHITDDATFLTFEKTGFRLLRSGSNNFTCFVVKNPQGRFEPACLNEQAMRSISPTYELEMALLYGGTEPREVYRQILAAFNDDQLSEAETGSLVYMMSPNNLGFDPDTGILAPTPVHQMYYFPKLKDVTFSLWSESPARLWQGYPHLSALIVDSQSRGPE